MGVCVAKHISLISHASTDKFLLKNIDHIHTGTAIKRTLHTNCVTHNLNLSAQYHKVFLGRDLMFAKKKL